MNREFKIQIGSKILKTSYCSKNLNATDACSKTHRLLRRVRKSRPHAGEEQAGRDHARRHGCEGPGVRPGKEKLHVL